MTLVMKKFVYLLWSLLLGIAAFGQQAHVLDSGLVFGQAPFASCHAATICQTREGDLLVAFFGGSWEGCRDVGIWMCRKDNMAKLWTVPECVATGRVNDSIQHPCWNPVLYRLGGKKDEVWLFYKTGVYIPEWVGHLMCSKDGGYSWSDPVTLNPGLLGAIKNKPLRVGRRIIAPSSTEPAWQPHFEVSTNNGRSWRKVKVPLDTSIIAIQPAILQLPGDTLMALMRTKNGFLARTLSTNLGRTWSAMELTDIPNNNSGIDAMTLSNGQHVMVYTPLGLNPGSEFGPRTPLVLAVSKDGRSWHDVLTLEQQAGEYSYPSIIEGADGTLHVVYTFQRKRIKYAHILLK